MGAIVSAPAVTIRRSTILIGLFVLFLLGGWAGFTGWYILRKDDLAARLITRETVRQYAYEDRIAALRGEIDRLSSRALLDQDSVEARVSELMTRQSQLESRQALVAMLADNLRGLGEAQPGSRQISSTGSIRAGDIKTASGKPLPGKTLGLPGAASAFTPPNTPEPETAEANSSKPMPFPEPPPLRGSDRKHISWQDQAVPETREQKIGGEIGKLASALDQTQTRQIKALGGFDQALSEALTRYRAVVSEINLDADRLAAAATATNGQGGPLIPLNIDPKAGTFEAAIYRLQPKISQFSRLKKVVEALPLRRPMPASDSDMTSNFGYRLDPFTRSPAMHSGIDFKAEQGSPVKSTGAGKVIAAEYSGGYGNMVEIDHGNGITTRYGHMSAILVSEGQTVAAGTIIGRVGTTGRSTGPHLHYETRIEEEAVDPHRFIRAGQKFNS